MPSIGWDVPTIGRKSGFITHDLLHFAIKEGETTVLEAQTTIRKRRAALCDLLSRDRRHGPRAGRAGCRSCDQRAHGQLDPVARLSCAFETREVSFSSGFGTASVQPRSRGNVARAYSALSASAASTASARRADR